MGKYMRKGKGVEKMSVMEGALGVRTRARALALLQESKNQSGSTPTKASRNTHSKIPSQCLATTVLPTHNEMHRAENYLELRSRRLEKTPATKRSTMAAGDRISRHNLLNNAIASCSASDNEPSTIRSLSPFNSILSIPGRTTAHGEHLCLDSSGISGALLTRVTPTVSTSDSICMSGRQPVCTPTRRQRQENVSLAIRQRMDLDEEVAVSRAADQSRVDDANAFSAEAEQSVGETAISKCKKDRESTPESHAPGMDTPGSTTRSRHTSRDHRSVRHINCIPSSSEIEDFFQDAEKQEQSKFIERYNFDPANEKPVVGGRYEWICL